MKPKNTYYVTFLRKNKVSAAEFESWVIISTEHDLYTSQGLLKFINDFEKLYSDYTLIIRDWKQLLPTSENMDEISRNTYTFR